VDMTCERLYRQYGMPRSRSASRRPSRPWKWIVGAAAGGASIAAAITLVWAVGTAKLDDGATSQHALADAVGALQHKVATLESSVAKKPADRAAAVSVAQLRAAIAQLEARLDAGAGKTSTKLTQFASQLEKLDAQSSRESAAKLSEITERLDRLHHQIATISMETTGSIPKPTPAAAPLLPFHTTAAVSPPREIRAKETQAHHAEAPRPLDNWVLRGVHDGTALVEGAEGLREVTPGSVLPGAGRVKSIERHGANWVVITTAGVIDPRIRPGIGARKIAHAARIFAHESAWGRKRGRRAERGRLSR
ncbi:MAG: hypothetical protein WA733_11725, partial [Methylocystis sp.]